MHPGMHHSSDHCPTAKQQEKHNDNDKCDDKRVLLFVFMRPFSLMGNVRNEPHYREMQGKTIAQRDERVANSFRIGVPSGPWPLERPGHPVDHVNSPHYILE